MSKNIIRDGYTKEGYIAPQERLHEELHFSYRPLLAEQVDAVEEGLLRVPAVAGNRLIHAALARQLVDWSEVNDKGRAEKISPKTIGRLPWPVLNRLFKIVAGRDAKNSGPG